MEATVTPTTGTTTPTTTAVSAAPATSVAPAERPTFAQAFASDAAPSSATQAPPEAATTQPAESTTTEAPVHPSAEQAGPIPFKEHKTILENTRVKGHAAGRAEAEAELGWAKGLDRATYEEAARIGHLYRTDQPAFWRQLIAEAAGKPETLAVLRSEAARVLGSRAPQPQSAVPDIPIVNEQGQVVGNLREIVSQHLAEFSAKELDPIKRDYATRQQAEQARQKAENERQEQAQLQQTVTTLHERALAEMPHFKEHEQEIAAVFEKTPGEPEAALYRAWMQVVLPKLNATSQAQALDDLKTKAAASIANPASAAVATAKRPRSFTDPSLKW